MSAKKNSQASRPAASAAPSPAPVAASTAGAAASAGDTPWIESSDPRRRRIGQIALVVIWVYVAALWLLALDQWFNWGIFGPKIPPLP